MTWQNARDAVAGAVVVPGASVDIHHAHAIYNRLEQRWVSVVDFHALLKDLEESGEVTVTGEPFRAWVRFEGPVLLLPDGRKVIPVALDVDQGDDGRDGRVRRTWPNVHSLAQFPHQWTFHDVPRGKP